jgi:hypothetical protein
MRKKEFYSAEEVIIPSYRKLLLPVMTVWFVIQILLPIRHWIIPGDVLWTEEGHRMSWRMMLRGRYGTTNFYVVDKNDPEAPRKLINKKDYLSKKQLRLVSSKPDAMWQFAQKIKVEYAAKEKDIAIYVSSKVSINGKKYQTLIDPKVDLASASWNYFTTNPWVLKHEEKE